MKQPGFIVFRFSNSLPGGSRWTKAGRTRCRNSRGAREVLGRRSGSAQETFEALKKNSRSSLALEKHPRGARCCSPGVSGVHSRCHLDLSKCSSTPQHSHAKSAVLSLQIYNSLKRCRQARRLRVSVNTTPSCTP